jgi:hypothetical protein
MAKGWGLKMTEREKDKLLRSLEIFQGASAHSIISALLVAILE